MNISEVVLIIFIALFGLCSGSFINVLIYRIPEGKSIVFPPSACPECGKRLLTTDLLPLVSYVILGGKCRYCKGKISMVYPMVEFIAAVISVAMFLKFGLTLEFIAYTYLLYILLAVFVIDIKHRIIPDGLVLAGLVAGAAVFVYNIFIPFKPFDNNSWWWPLAGLAVGSGSLFLVALLGALIYKTDDAMGFGDVKIFAPIGLLLGFNYTVTALFLSVVLGGAFGLVLLIFKFKDRKDTIPFGPFIVAGTLIAILLIN